MTEYASCLMPARSTRCARWARCAHRARRLTDRWRTRVRRRFGTFVFASRCSGNQLS